MITEYELKRFEFGLQQMITEAMLDARANVEYDLSMRAMVTTLTTLVWGNEMDKVIEYPAGWWNAVKDALPLPAWVKRYLKIKYRRYSFNILYPDFKPIVNKGTTVIKVWNND